MCRALSSGRALWLTDHFANGGFLRQVLKASWGSLELFFSHLTLVLGKWRDKNESGSFLAGLLDARVTASPVVHVFFWGFFFWVFFLVECSQGQLFPY